MDVNVTQVMGLINCLVTCNHYSKYLRVK